MGLLVEGQGYRLSAWIQWTYSSVHTNQRMICPVCEYQAKCEEIWYLDNYHWSSSGRLRSQRKCMLMRDICLDDIFQPSVDLSWM